jgi:hypothetical protein
MKILCHDVAEYKENQAKYYFFGLNIEYKSYGRTEQIAQYRIKYSMFIFSIN